MAGHQPWSSLRHKSDLPDKEQLAEQLRLAEAVIAAAKGPNSTHATVDAITAYEAKYGQVEARRLTAEEQAELG